jgi:hypothetical protein
MTAKELMKTRFEVIADYPSSPFKVGDIITYDGIVYGMGEPQKFTRDPEKYPHLFRKMNWWEKRTSEQMPKKVMSILDDKGDTFDIEEWDMKILVGWVDKKMRTCCSLLTFNPEYGYVPVD